MLKKGQAPENLVRRNKGDFTCTNKVEDKEESQKALIDLSKSIEGAVSLDPDNPELRRYLEFMREGTSE
jgi:hypothetical protein